MNASPSISGRYPNLGPLILVEAGIPLVDSVGPLLLEKVREGDAVRLSGDRLFIGDRLVAVGIRQSHASVLRAMEQARRTRSDERFESFARNTLEYLQRGARPALRRCRAARSSAHDLAGRPVLVVVRGLQLPGGPRRAPCLHPRHPARARRAWTAARTRSSTRATSPT